MALAVLVAQMKMQLPLMKMADHFYDAPASRKTETEWCLMDYMIQQVKEMNLQRPTVRKRKENNN